MAETSTRLRKVRIDLQRAAVRAFGVGDPGTEASVRRGEVLFAGIARHETVICAAPGVLFGTRHELLQRTARKLHGRAVRQKVSGVVQ